MNEFAQFVNLKKLQLDQGYLSCRTQLLLPGPVAVVFAVIVFIVVVIIVVVLFVVVFAIVILVVVVLIVVVLVVIFLVVIFLVVNFLDVFFISYYYEWLADPDRHPDVPPKWSVDPDTHCCCLCCRYLCCRCLRYRCFRFRCLRCLNLKFFSASASVLLRLKLLLINARLADLRPVLSFMLIICCWFLTGKYKSWHLNCFILYLYLLTTDGGNESGG